MKVRWTATSLRLRITPSELAALLRGETIGERALFAGGWSVTLGVADDTALHSNDIGQVTLTLSSGDLARLVSPDTEGVYFADGDIRYFVEKDFPCAHPRPALVAESTETFTAPPGFADRHRRGG